MKKTLFLALLGGAIIASNAALGRGNRLRLRGSQTRRVDRQRRGQIILLLGPITLAGGVKITPEVTVFDKMDDETNSPEGTELWLGAKFQINF